MTGLVGRERELAQIERFLSAAAHGLAVLRIEGDAGIGKSALLAETVMRARGRGLHVVQGRPVAAEAKLAFATLGDVVGPLATGDLAWIPEPQRLALDVALVRRSGPAAGVAPQALSAAVLALLARAAEERPLLVAIDDVQWLDAASAAALGFAIRRLTDTPLGVVLTQRLDEGQPTVTLPGIEGLQHERTTTIRLGPLSLSGTYHVIRSHLGQLLPRPVLRRIHEAARGNPFFAIELARATPGGSDVTNPSMPVPVPASVHGFVARKVRGQPIAARRAMLITGLSGAPTDGLVRAVDEEAADRLDGLVGAGILDRHEGRLRFAHPLLADMAIAAFDAPERRAMHRRLADAVVDPEARARHRALGLEGPDAAVAGELTAVAESVAPTSVETACELMELALAATPASDLAERADRLVALALLRHRAGDTGGASALLDEVITTGPSGQVRAAALELRAQVYWVAGGADHAVACCQDALAEPGLDLRLRARILVTCARVSMDHEATRRLATDALELLDRLPRPDPALTAEALTALAGAEVAAGRGIPWPLVERALALEADEPPAEVSDRMSASVGVWLKYAGQLEEARTWLRRTRDTAFAEGAESSLPYALSHLPQLELWMGDWDAAAALAKEHLTLAEWTGQREQRLTAVYSIALVEAHAGRLDSARAWITETLPEAERTDEWNVYQLLATLGFVELSAGRPHDAIPMLGRAYEIYESAAGADITIVHENFMEALVAVGDVRAAEVIARCMERATSLSTPMALVPAFRARALLLAAAGDLDGALADVERALDESARLPVPFMRARTLLASGVIHRRRNERRAAREALEEARDTFARLGASVWLELTARELDRIPARRPAKPDALTPTERRVAELVAAGMTNGEVAAHLFVTPKTVEANLTRVYAKLGVRSRSELARVALDGEPVEAKQ